MTLSEKLFRLKARFKDPEWRRYGKLLLVGKFLGIAMVLACMIGLPTTAFRIAEDDFRHVAQAQDDDGHDSGDAEPPPRLMPQHAGTGARSLYHA